MDYFKILNLKREPFSNSPDPDFFFQSAEHVDCLQKLELSLRLCRGLNVVIGDVGTGKTTLCRQLIRKFSGDADFETLLILDPYFKRPKDALLALADLFGIDNPGSGKNEFSERYVKEEIKQHLFVRGVEKGKTVVLIIDEGQKIPLWFLEILREFLNYETNQFKLLQIVIFAQKEFESILARCTNFTDRINLYHRLDPLKFFEMVRMIQFRLERAGCLARVSLFFSYPALLYVFRATGGYPRKIVHLCHQAMLMMIIRNKARIDLSVARACAKRGLFKIISRNRFPAGKWAAAAIIVMAFFLGRFSDGPLDRFRLNPEWAAAKAALQEKAVPTPICGKGSTAPVESAASPPKILGRVSVKKEETLEGLIRKIYSTYDPQLLQAVLAVNPQIDSPHRLSIGDQIFFPAREVNSASVQVDGYRIEIAETRQLRQILSLFTFYSARQEASLKILPHWKPGSDLVFTLILDEYLTDEAHARNRFSELQTAFDQSIQVIRGWSEGTKLYAPPPVP